MLVKRMVLLFFRDKLNVFFSLLSALMILLLYILFLGRMMEQGLEAAIGFWNDQIRVTMTSVIMAGMVAVTSVTSCLGALGVAVSDKEESGKDFYTSPIPRWKISLGYILGAGLVGLIMTVIALVLVIGYLSLIGGELPGIGDMGLLVLTVCLSALCANAMMYFATLFIKTENSFSGFSTITGTLIGFLMGIFMPVGNLPGGVQWVVRLFPMSHAAAMFREILAGANLEVMFAGAADAPMTLEQFKVFYGVVFEYGHISSSFWFSAAVLLGCALLFFGLSVGVMRGRKIR